MQYILRRYSIVNKMVKIHSAIVNIFKYFAEYSGTLSKSTAKTLNKIVIINSISNNFPDGVSVP